MLQFADANSERMFSSELVQRLTIFPGRPWGTLLRGKPIDERWLARQLHPFGIRPRNLRISGQQAKGYEQKEILDVCLRYVTKSELREMMDELKAAPEETASNGEEKGPRATSEGDMAGADI